MWQTSNVSKGLCSAWPSRRVSSRTSWEGRRRSHARPRPSFPNRKRWPAPPPPRPTKLPWAPRSPWSRPCSLEVARPQEAEAAGELLSTYCFSAPRLEARREWIWPSRSRIPSPRVAPRTTKWCHWSTWSATALLCNSKSQPPTQMAAAERTLNWETKTEERRARKQLQASREERLTLKRSRVY